MLSPFIELLERQWHHLAAAMPLILTVVAIACSIYGIHRLRRVANIVSIDGSQRIPVIAAIGTANPPWKGGQDSFMKVCESIQYDPDMHGLIDKIVSRSGIESRHTCVTTDGSKYMAMLEAHPRARAEKWEEWAPKMAVEAAQKALSRWTQGSASDITHVVVHSCTGFSAPGIDFHLIQKLGLKPSVRKIGVNFMGCFGAFTGLYTAKQIIEADSTGKAAVLVVCSETCSVHMTRDKRVELIIGNALFADGAAAALVTHAGFSSRPAAEEAPAFEWAIGDMASDIVPDSAHCMTWKGGSQPGQYDMWLDKSIPQLLAGMFAKSGLSLLSKVGITSAWSCGWAIHPGGKAIIKAFEEAFKVLRISSQDLSHSTQILKEYGNMSSPTILFVLERVLAATQSNEVFFAGFGPGLTIEFGRLYKVTGAHASAITQQTTTNQRISSEVRPAPSTNPLDASPVCGPAS